MRLAAAVVMRSGMLTTSLCWMVDVSGPQNDSARSGACGPEGDPVCGGDHPLGGQAVLEGVMMRGRRSWGLAVRRPDGQITLCSYPLSSLSERYSVLRVPVVREVLAFLRTSVWTRWKPAKETCRPPRQRNLQRKDPGGSLGGRS